MNTAAYNRAYEDDLIAYLKEGKEEGDPAI
jgi:hypothetical protein